MEKLEDLILFYKELYEGFISEFHDKVYWYIISKKNKIYLKV